MLSALVDGPRAPLACAAGPDDDDDEDAPDTRAAASTPTLRSCRASPSSAASATKRGAVPVASQGIVRGRPWSSASSLSLAARPRVSLSLAETRWCT